MSSLTRRIQIRIMKRIGYTRRTHGVVNDQIVRLAKGEGNIIAPDSSDTGSRHYPRLVHIQRPAEALAA